MKTFISTRLTINELINIQNNVFSYKNWFRETSTLKKKDNITNLNYIKPFIYSLSGLTSIIKHKNQALNLILIKYSYEFEFKQLWCWWTCMWNIKRFRFHTITNIEYTRKDSITKALIQKVCIIYQDQRFWCVTDNC